MLGRVKELSDELKQLLLGPPRWTLSVAESVTCGQVQARVGAISGASQFFLGGITAYALDQKVRHLGVDRAAARAVNSVSPSVAAQMAEGACRLFGSDLAVGLTGYAEPAPDLGAEHPHAWWAIAHRVARRIRVVGSGRVECPGATRVDAQVFTAEAVLVELVEYLRRRR